jgi:hypothetical protein
MQLISSMKTILSISIISFCIGCTAQIQTIPIERNKPWGNLPNAYHKDVHNYFNPFEGTWVYEGSGVKLTFSFYKKEMVYDSFNGGFYSDLLVGEYKYEVNGTVLLNTLPNLYTPGSGFDKNNIWGMHLYPNKNFPECIDCEPFEVRLSLGLRHVNQPLLDTRLILRKRTISGIDYIEATVFSTIMTTFNNEIPADPNELVVIPAGSYLMQRQ